MLLVLALLACSEPAPAPAQEPAAPAPAPADPAPAPADEALAKAEAAAKSLGGKLKARVVEAMGAGGPVAALTVCAEEAQGLTAIAAAESGAKVGRSSLRLRNPDNAGPEWVTAWLTAQGERAAEGVAPSKVVEGDVARVILPIAVEPPCLVCHGDPATLPADIKALLAQRYPADAATGYAAGDLRGALWAEVAVASVGGR